LAASDKQFDILLGISRSMEKSLAKIEESLNTTAEKAGKAGNVLAALSSSLGSMIGAISGAKIDKKKSDTVLSFAQGLIKLTNQVDSSKAQEFADAMSGIGEGIESISNVMTPGKILKLHLAAKILFEGKKPLIKRIATGLADAFKDLDAGQAKEGSEAIKNMGEGLLSLTKAMGKLALIGLAAPLIFIGALVARGVVGLFVSLGKNAKALQKGGDAISAIGKGLGMLAMGMAAIALAVLVIGPAKILESIVVISAFALVFVLIGQGARSISSGAKALALVGLALFGFAAGLAMLMLAIIIATPKLVLEGILYIAAFGLVFALLGKADKYIAQGALLMIGMAVALFLFSGGLMVFGLALKLFTWESALMGGVLILGLGAAMAGLGKFSGQIDKGALAMAAMGVGLAVFSVGLMIFGLAVKLWLALFKDDLLTAGLMAGGLIIGLGLAIAGIGLIAGYIVAGSIGLAAMGVGLSLFSIGVMIFGLAIKTWMALFKDDLITAGLMAAGLILGLGLAISVIGLMAVPIILGSIALSTMGVGLMIFSVGLIAFALAIKLIESIFEDLTQAGIIAGSVILGLGLALSVLGLLAAPIILGSVALSMMGVSLVIFSIGLVAFAGAVKLIESIFDDLTQAGIIAGGIILGLGLAYSIIGVMAPLVILGAVSMTLMGATLLVFSVGLLAFAGAVKLTMSALGSDVDSLGDKVGSVLTGIGTAFGEIGLQIIQITLGSAAMILMGASLLIAGVGLAAFGGALALLNNKGLIIKDDDGKETIKGLGVLEAIATSMSNIGWTFLTEPWALLGIASSIGMGVSLAAIGMGLTLAGDAMSKIPDMSKFISGLFAEETGLIPAMARAFAGIGEKYSGGVLGFLAGLIGADPVSKGMRTVQGMGAALQDIAGGIVAFADFSQFPVKVPDPSDPSRLVYTTVDIFTDVMPALRENLPTLLTALADVFASIGNKYGGGFLSDGPVKAGVDAVKGIGSVLSEIAGGVVAFANFDEFPVQIAGKDGKLKYKNIVLWDEIPKIKKNLIGNGKIGDLKSSGLLFSLASIFGVIGEKYGDGFFTDGPVKKGVNAVKGIGKVVSELAEGIVAFANMQRGLPNYDKDGKFNGTYTKFKIKDVQTNIIRVLHALPKVFAGLDVSAFEEAQEKAKAAVPLAQAIGKIGKALLKLQSKTGENGVDPNALGLMGSSLKSFAISIKGMEIDADKVKSVDKLADAIKKMADSGDKLKGFAEALANTAKSLTTFSGAFEPFSKKLDKFERFEHAFSNLSKNAHAYKFDKFAKDVGVLKENVNAFNVENLKITDSLMKSLAILSKSPDALGQTIKQSIEKAFEELVDALKSMIKESTPSPVNTPVASSPTIPNPLSGGTNTPAKGAAKSGTAANTASVLAKTDIQSAFVAALEQYGAAKKPMGS
jgi:hypothetical protein